MMRRATGHMLMKWRGRRGRRAGDAASSGRFATQPAVFERFGPDRGADIPIATEWTRGLKPLLDRFGNDPRLTLILFCLDESTYSRESAPLAGHYPALRLGIPWWFYDSFNGMRRYSGLVMETAGPQAIVQRRHTRVPFDSCPSTCGGCAASLDRQSARQRLVAGPARVR
jgi:hypothetical protein